MEGENAGKRTLLLTSASGPDRVVYCCGDGRPEKSSSRDRTSYYLVQSLVVSLPPEKMPLSFEVAFIPFPGRPETGSETQSGCSSPQGGPRGH